MSIRRIKVIDGNQTHFIRHEYQCSLITLRLQPHWNGPVNLQSNRLLDPAISGGSRTSVLRIELSILLRVLPEQFRPVERLLPDHVADRLVGADIRLKFFK